MQPKTIKTLVCLAVLYHIQVDNYLSAARMYGLGKAWLLKTSAAIGRPLDPRVVDAFTYDVSSIGSKLCSSARGPDDVTTAQPISESHCPPMPETVTTDPSTSVEADDGDASDMPLSIGDAL